jgi:hypothetical protein
MRMVFQDGSDFASIGEDKVDSGAKGKSRLPGVEEVKRGEDFVTAGVSLRSLAMTGGNGLVKHGREPTSRPSTSQY